MNEKESASLLHYAKTCLKRFEELPFNEVDSALFCWLSYLNIHEAIEACHSGKGMPIFNLIYAEHLDASLQNIYKPEEMRLLLYAVVSNPRYRSVRIKYFCNESHAELALQFSAMVFSLSEEKHFVAFRGTDHSLHAWKEDALLLLNQGAPCQTLAVNYLNGIAERLRGELILGGHSKGGHNAVYSAAFCKASVQERITAVYNHDGPGFLQADLQTPGMQRIRSRVHKTIPTGSPVGLILANEAEPKFIESTQLGVFRHYPCSWPIENDAFRAAQDRSVLVHLLTQNINRWAESVSETELRAFIDGLFDIVEMTGLSDFSQVFSSPVKCLLLFAEQLQSTDPTHRQFILNTLFDALSGRVDNQKTNDAVLRKYGIDWKQIDRLLKPRESDDTEQEERP